MADLTREELAEFGRLVRLATQHEPPPNPLTRIVDRQRLGDWCAARGGEGTVFLRLLDMAERAVSGPSMPINPSDTTRAHALLTSLGIEHSIIEQAVAREIAAAREERDAEWRAAFIAGFGPVFMPMPPNPEAARHFLEGIAQSLAEPEPSAEPPPAATTPCPTCKGTLSPDHWIKCLTCRGEGSIPSAGAAGGTAK